MKCGRFHVSHIALDTGKAEGCSPVQTAESFANGISSNAVAYYCSRRVSFYIVKVLRLPAGTRTAVRISSTCEAAWERI